ncbi:MAG: hypothetical protein JSS63_07885 [Bacteroidetes bacterium]|nr:hypothetical protein [Bacteroidota bacterium]
MKKLIVIFLLALTNIIPAKTPLSIQQTKDDIYINLNSYKIFLVSGGDTLVKISSLFKLPNGELFKDSLKLFPENQFVVLYSNNDNVWKEFDYEFQLKGDESEVLIKLEYNRIILTNITVLRYYKAPSEVEIIPHWPELIGSEPAFKLINNSSFTFNSLFNEFWGNTYKFTDAKWVLESLGGICGTRGEGPSFKPGDTIISMGADFIGPDYAVQEKGKYKYVVEMSTGDALNFGRPVPQSYPDKKTYDIYILEKEFEIKSDSVHYPRSNYEKIEIRGIYNIQNR